MTRRTLLLATLSAVLCTSVAAQNTEPRTATKEEYRACLDAGDLIERRKSELDRFLENHRTLAKKIQVADEHFNSQVKRHPPRTNAELASYNSAIEKRNQVAKDFNERARNIQRLQSDLNTLVVQTNATCNVLLVSIEVKDAVENERKSREQPK